MLYRCVSSSAAAPSSMSYVVYRCVYAYLSYRLNSLTVFVLHSIKWKDKIKPCQTCEERRRNHYKFHICKNIRWNAKNPIQRDKSQRLFAFCGIQMIKSSTHTCASWFYQFNNILATAVVVVVVVVDVFPIELSLLPDEQKLFTSNISWNANV